MSSVRLVDAAFEQATPVVSDEAAFIAELQAGSEEAFSYLVAIYQNPVFNLISHMVANEAEAADILQNVFLKILRGIGNFHEKSSLKTWIYRIAIHEALNFRRNWVRRLFHEPFSVDDESLRLRVQGITVDGRETPYRAYERAERQVEVERALASLAQPYRAVVLLREIEDLSYEEIAHVLGIAEGTVKSRLRRGREMLKRKLAPRFGG